MKSKEYINKSFTCKYCGQIHSIPIKFIEKGDFENLGEIMRNNFKEKKEILILTDNITEEVAGKKCEEILKRKFKTKLLSIYPGKEERVTAKQEYLFKIEKEIKNCEIILTAGTGTITDLGKIIGDKYNIPVVCFPTAPSMNGYTSPVAAYIKDGVKITIPVKVAYGVFINEEIIKNSPVELMKAGFADSLAKAYANSDWKISSILTGEKYCPLPYIIMSEVEKKYVEKGEKIEERDGEFINLLMDSLNLGGISMIIAGSSSPASGAEHLISHFLDMYACENNLNYFAYHGIQVGCGIYISSIIYSILKEIKKEEIKRMIEKTNLDYRKKFEKLTKIFPKGKKILEKEFSKKIEDMKILRENLPEKWDEIKENCFPMVYSPSEIKGFFTKAQVPYFLQQIKVNEEIIYDDITLSRFIRARIVISDIADEIGILEKIAADYVKGNFK